MGDLADKLAAMDAERRRYTLQTLPTHLAESRHEERLRQVLTTFEFLMAKVAAAMINGLVADYQLAEAVLSEPGTLAEWAGFLRERLHMLFQGGADWPPDRVLRQLAAEHADDSPITHAAASWLEGIKDGEVWLRRASRPLHAPPRTLLASIPLGDMVLDLIVDRDEIHALALTAQITVSNTVEQPALWRVNLETLQAQRLDAALQGRWGMRIPDEQATLNPAPGVSPRYNPDQAEGREQRLASIAIQQISYMVDWDMAPPAYFLDGGRRLVTGTHDGVIRIWDANALEQSAAEPDAGDAIARAALDQAREQWSIKGMTDTLIKLKTRQIEVGIPLSDDPYGNNTPHKATEMSWETMNRNLQTLRFRFDTAHRLELWQRGGDHPLACWISPTPLIEVEYDNVMLTSTLAVRAVRAGSGLAVETSAGRAVLVEVWRGNQRLDLGALDSEVG